ncbi:MAG: 7,8-didemethyl-8-hydroxy-5-deazariboflavin synthase [Betaproteobacteria bacterium RIFCSPLOWO2_12_FULL_65_110]|nr:MAG: 7,8-didemethyl-8-hydroxy-5-deazariboflavin synthase [Betaproteobacteria bacterium RIFCSPLOWO2_12_FULL_65_110]
MYSDVRLRELLEREPSEHLLEEAGRMRDQGHGARISFSRKVFVPLTRLCRDACHYCTFATTPGDLKRAYLTPDEVLGIARAGQAAGCREALFTLGDKPELRWPEARRALDDLGHASTIDYLAAMCELVLEETGLLPHTNPGVLTRDELAHLRTVSVSQGLMLESASGRLCERGGPHHGSPDKHPAARLETIRLAGELAIPFTSGILIGIGETREERLEALLALRGLHLRYGHIQEIIVQNFRAKPGTPMAAAHEPELEDLQWTVALARFVFGPQMNIQVPPNLSPAQYPRLVEAGINDWGGVSPVTPDHVNPEAPWPHIESLRQRTAAAGNILVERLASYPAYCRDAARWHDARLMPHLQQHADADGYARADGWSAGGVGAIPSIPAPERRRSTDLDAVLDRAMRSDPLAEHEIVRLFAARADEVAAVCDAADALRSEASGDIVRYVVNRNINYTNVCHYGCRFCAFSKGRHSSAVNELRGAPYDLAHQEIARRVEEAWARGATEVCMQGGIHPNYTGETYLSILRTAKQAAPDMHVHAFSPLEVMHGATTLGLPVETFLERLRDAGLGSLPGTAAEILDDEVRKVICPDKIRTDEWLRVMQAAHRVGLRSTATIMFGHVETPAQVARHLLHIRDLQARTGGFTEFVPLPFIHMEAPMYLKGRARKGPTWREALLMHAVARIALHPLVPNIQASWVKLGPEGAVAALRAGANDLGGTLMNESISRAAGNEHGQELPPAQFDALIARAGREPRQRTTLYDVAREVQRTRSYQAAALLPIVLTPPKRRRESAGRHSKLSNGIAV